KQQLRVREFLAHDAERLDDPDRILPRIERLTCTTSGSRGRTPYWRLISSTKGRGISRFLTECGSMHGGANTVLSRGIDSGTNSGIVHTDASYCSMKLWKNFHTVWFASVRSMW